MDTLLTAGLALALLAPVGARADSTVSTSAEIQMLREEIQALRASYEARLQAMEQRLVAAERNAAPVATATATGSVTATAPAALAPAAPPVTATASAGSANAFNPAISLILAGGYTQTSQDPASYAITGFQLPVGSDAGPGSRGFGIGESELGLTASVDPWWRGALNLALHPDNTVSVEEAFVQTTALSNGLSLKAGRFLSGIGYLNSQHAHTWDFVDNPLAYQAFLGTQYGDDGLQLRWLAPTDQYLQIGLELGRGRSFPGSDTAGNGAGMSALTVHTGGDLGESHNWRAGLSLLSAKATDQGLNALDASGSMVSNAFSGSTRVWVVDGVWKWAPNGNATQTSFKLQGEYLQSTRSGSLTYDLSGANSMDAYRAVQSGWYLQGIYQFMPSWRLGLRTERLNAGTTDYGMNAASFSNSGYQPSKNSLMFDFTPSEFSRLRLQLAQDKSRAGLSDNQVFLQYQMSLGAHGAHSY
jgi:hypothetical protein